MRVMGGGRRRASARRAVSARGTSRVRRARHARVTGIGEGTRAGDDGSGPGRVSTVTHHAVRLVRSSLGARVSARCLRVRAARCVSYVPNRGNERKLCRRRAFGRDSEKKNDFHHHLTFSRLIALLSPHHDHPRPDGVPRDEPSLVVGVHLDERVHERLVAVLEHEHARVRGVLQRPHAVPPCRPPRPPSRPRCGPRGTGRASPRCPPRNPG